MRIPAEIFVPLACLGVFVLWAMVVLNVTSGRLQDRRREAEAKRKAKEMMK